MAERLTRAHRADLEVRGEDGRTVVGICCPFDEVTEIAGIRESFVRGSFARTIAERGAARVKFQTLHDDRKLPLGRATELREDAAGLYGEFKVSATVAGDEALALIRDGALDGLSIGFRPMRERRGAAGVVERIEVRLEEVSAVTWPAYDSARIAAVRSAIGPDDLRARLAAIGASPTHIDAEAALGRLVHLLEAP